MKIYTAESVTKIQAAHEKARRAGRAGPYSSFDMDILPRHFSSSFRDERRAFNRAFAVIAKNRSKQS